MSYADQSDPNPYAPPRADIGRPADQTGQPWVQYAGFWTRFVAVFLDGIIVGIISFGVGVAAGIVMVAMKVNPSEPGPQLFLNLVGLVIGLAYYAGMISSEKQATFGKMAMGIKVTDLAGRRISLGRAIGRELAKFLSAIILLIGYIMAAFTERKQALHDMIAGTLVVKSS